MMLLGLVLHAAASYTVNPLPDAWPYRDAQTNGGFDLLLFLIHLFRMPAFFVMAGFFAALLYRRDRTRGFIRNRLRRVALPLVVFWPIVMPLTGFGFAFAVHQSGTGVPPEPPGAGQLLHAPMLGHLWFLYNLLFYYAAAVAAVLVAPALPAGVRARTETAVHAVLTSPWGAAVLAGITLPALIPEGEPGIGLSASIIPRAGVLAAYGVFFGCGWTLHSHRDALSLYARRWKQHAAAGCLATAAYLFVLIMHPDADGGPWLLTGMALSVLSMWPLVLAIIGVFVAHMQTPRPLVRYFADGAFWIYIVHLPVTIWITGTLAQSAMPAVAKFGIVLVLTAVITTLTYNYLVRSTWIGVLLNGRRYRRGLPEATVDADGVGVEFGRP